MKLDLVDPPVRVKRNVNYIMVSAWSGFSSDILYNTGNFYTVRTKLDEQFMVDHSSSIWLKGRRRGKI